MKRIEEILKDRADLIPLAKLLEKALIDKLTNDFLDIVIIKGFGRFDIPSFVSDYRMERFVTHVRNYYDRGEITKEQFLRILKKEYNGGTRICDSELSRIEGSSDIGK